MRKLLVFALAVLGFYANSQSICGGQSYTLQATNPVPLNGPTYSLQPGGFTSPTGSFNVSPATTTNYTLYTTGINPNTNSVQTTSVVTQVTVNPQPTSNPTVTQANCTNSVNTVNLGVSFLPATTNYTVGWAPTLPGSVTSPTQVVASSLTPGPYTIAVFAAGGCSTTATFTINPAPAQAIFSVIPFGSTFSITCYQDTVQLVATNPNNTYTWSGSSFNPIVNDTINLTTLQQGTVGLVGTNTISGCTASYVFTLGQNLVPPTSTLSTNLISITCTQAVAPTLTVQATPSVNVTHFIYSPQGGTFSATSYTTIYYPGFPGTYTAEVRNDVNGCKTKKTFTVTTNDNFPTFSVQSVENYTLGCGTRSVASIDIVGAATTPTAGGPISYTIIGPPTSTVIPTGTLSGNPHYTMSVPGAWTVMVKDNTNSCITAQQISILTNTIPPNISAVVPLDILDCNTPTVLLTGQSETHNIQYNWGFTGTPGNLISHTILVNTKPTGTITDNYTLTVTDNNSTCKSTTIVPIRQNIFAPTASISALNNAAITCLTPTITLSNQSKTNIPAGSIFPANLPVQGYLWEGPTPQVPLQANSTYVAGVVGIYTLTAKDLNNGCISTGTYNVADSRTYPQVAITPVTIDCGDLSKTFSVTAVGTGSSSFTYSWSAPPTVTVGQSNLKNLPVTQPGTYTLLTSNPTNGCATITIAKASSGSLTAEFTATPDSGYAPLSVTFVNNSFSSSGTNSISASWNYGNGVTSGSVTPTGSFVPGPISSTQTPLVVYNQPGTYTVTMYATKGACLDTASTVIKVDIPSSLTIPNIFTPNADGVNDLFFLKASNLSEITLTIIDRWGHIVYDLTSKTGNIEWDGKNAEGKESAAGTYLYVLKATGTDGTKYDKKGTITLVR